MRKLQLTLCSCLLLYSFVTQKSDGQTLASNVSRKTETGIRDNGQSKIAVTITGRVTDSKGLPLPGVSVQLKGTSLGAVTDVNGKYSVSIPEQSGTLVFSFISFKTQEVTIGASTTINIRLEEDSTALNEVVVIGYGTTRKVDLTGSQSSISAKEFAQQPVSRVDQVLQGRAAGVQVTNASGAPGSDVRIRVRGANSVLGNNDPLYVVDGFVGADFSIVNPSDIESIQILKDAASTAIYGSRGANGVVIISTKKGIKGGFKVTYEVQGSTSEVVKRWDVLNAYDYATLANERSVALGTSPIFTQAQVDQYKYNPGTDWQDLVFRRANGQQHLLSFSGGSDKTTYLVSANYVNQDGVVQNSGFKRYGVRSNLNTQLTDDFSMRFNFTGTRIENHNTGQHSGTGNPIVEALAWSPTTLPYDASGHFTASDPTGSVATNPLDFLYDLENDDNRNQANIIGGVNYKLPLDGLSLDLQYGVNYTGVQDASWGGIYLTRNNPFAGRGTDEQITLQSTSSLNYNHTFNKVHNINAVAVFETQKYVDNSFSANGNTLKFPALGYYNLSLANSYSVGAGYTKSSLLSYLGRVSYSYKDKYLLSLAVRRDGSSKFAEGNKYSTFPSIGLGYNLSEEDFIKGMNLFSNLKLRGSWGMTGSQAIGPYATLSTYATGTPAAFNDNSVLYGIQIGNPGNPLLRWETTRQTDVGIEMGFLHGSLTLEADYFIKNTSDLLLNLQLPAYAGSGTETKNAGSVQNKGFDITIGANLVKTNGFRWSSNFNISMVKNKVVSLGGIANRIPQGTNVGGGMSTTDEFMLQPGYSLGSYWGLNYLGTWKPGEAAEAAKYNEKPGDSRYEDVNNDGAINNNDYKIIGKGIPTTTTGWNNTFSYKALTLNVFFQGVFGIDKLDYTRAAAMSGSGDARQYILSEIKNRYIPGVNETSNIPAFSSTNVVITQSSRFIENGNYVRLKNVSLSYNFPSVFKTKSNIKVFVSATNLLTFTKYKGLDPESSNIGSFTDTAQGIDYGSYPNSKTYTAGINLSY